MGEDGGEVGEVEEGAPGQDKRTVYELHSENDY